MARFRSLTVDPIRSLAASATANARLLSILDALSGWSRTGPTGPGGYDFSDDPQGPGGFGPDDQTIRVRPGPVRTTLIRSGVVRPPLMELRRRMTNLDLHVFDDPLNYPHRDRSNPDAWILEFLDFFDLEHDSVSILPGEKDVYKYIFKRASFQKYMTLEEVVDAIVFEGTFDGLRLDRAAVTAAVIARAGPYLKLPDLADGQVSITLMFIPQTWHLNNPSDPAALQVQGAYQLNIASEKRPYEKDDDFSLDFSLLAQATLMYDTVRRQLIGQPMVGGQLTLTEHKFLLDIIDLQEFAQMLDGVTFGEGSPPSKTVSRTATGKVSSTTLATVQGAVGVQINFNVIKNKLALFIQAQGSLTGNRGPHEATLTLDGNVAIGVTVFF
jgi:hypothetical protein